MDEEVTPLDRRNALLEDLISELDAVHAGVLFWMMRGANDEQVADELFKAGIIKEKWGAASIVARRTQLYKDLGYPTDLHKDIKRPLFEFECFPIIKLLTNNEAEKIKEFPLRKKVIETAPPVPEKTVEQPVEQIVEQEKPIEQPVEQEKPVGQPLGQKPQPEPSPERSAFLIGIILGILIGVLATVAYFTFFRNLLQAPAPTETAAPSLTSLPTSNVLPTDTLQPVLPIDTEIPTNAPTLIATQTLTVTPLPADTHSPFGLMEGEELSNDKVTLKFTDSVFYEGFGRIARQIAAITYRFEYTNHSGGTILLRVDGSNFKVTDNLGIEYPCVFEDGLYTTPELDKSVENGSTLQILLRCGPNQEIGDDVNEITLTVSGSPDLIESTWVVVP